MTKKNYVSPIDQSFLTFETIPSQTDSEKKFFRTSTGELFEIMPSGIIDFTYPVELPSTTIQVRDFYNNRAEDYDKYLHLTFYTHNKDEQEERKGFIDKLKLQSDSKVLEIACGTGRDTVFIAEQLGSESELYVQDIAPKMLERCVGRLKAGNIKAHYSLGNAAYLPFPNNYFDAVYSFGGLGEFPDIKRSLSEMARVCKTGGRVVVGDESMPPWLRDTEFAKILITTNPQFTAEVPLEELPLEARDVNLQWVIGGVFYLIDFTVGDGAPSANFDFEIPGIRGGTYRTRYYGQLEGVSKESFKLAHKAREKSGKSMHKWLDDVVRKAAKKELGDCD